MEKNVRETDAESTEIYSEYTHMNAHTHTHTHTRTHTWMLKCLHYLHTPQETTWMSGETSRFTCNCNMVPCTLKDLKSAIRTAQTRLQRAHSISTVTAIWLIPLTHTANHCWQTRKRMSLTWQAISITHWQTADFFFFLFLIRKHSLISCCKKDKLHAEKQVLLG